MPVGSASEGPRGRRAARLGSPLLLLPSAPAGTGLPPPWSVCVTFSTSHPRQGPRHPRALDKLSLLSELLTDHMPEASGAHLVQCCRQDGGDGGDSCKKGHRSLSGQLWREQPGELVKDGRSHPLQHRPSWCPPYLPGDGAGQDLAPTLKPPFPPAPPAGHAGARPLRGAL